MIIINEGKFKYFFFFLFLIGCWNISEGQDTSVRILTYNVHHCNPPDKPGVIEINTIAEVINSVNPDVVALQEIDVNTERSGKPINEAEELAKKTGMHAFFLKTIDYQGGAYGIAILSRLKWIKSDTMHLPMSLDSGGEPRGMASVTVQLENGKRFAFACTHLDLKPENRIEQIKTIKDRIEQGFENPVILAGDFNSRIGSEVINILDGFLERTCEECKPTIPSDNPRIALDFIAFSPGKFEVKKHEVINGVYGSDHLPVFAELKLKY